VTLKWRVIVIITVLGSLFISGWNISATPSNNLKVSFIDVGKGDSILIQDETGFNVLIDGGIPMAGAIVIDFMREQGVDEIDVMVASHAHKDHIGGLIEVLRETDIPVNQILYNGDSGDTEIWADFADAALDRRLTLTPAHYPMTYTWGTSTAYVLNPVSDPLGLNQAIDNQNAKSVVILLDHADVDFLFTGDIDSLTEAAILSRATSISAKILKVPHHGSGSSSSDAFLAAVNPVEAIISVGDNSSGYPNEETLYRLLAAGARIWRTDQSGTIVVLSDGVSYSIYGLQTLGYQVFLPIVIDMIQ
jgi:competence protein ComEC